MGGRADSNPDASWGWDPWWTATVHHQAAPSLSGHPKKAALGLGVQKEGWDGTASQGTVATGEGPHTSHPPKQPCLRAPEEALAAELPSPQRPHVIQHRQHGVITGQKVLVEDLQLHDILEGEQSEGRQEGGWRRKVSGTG